MSAKPVLALSFAVNLALAGTLVWALKSKPAAPEPAPAPAVAPVAEPPADTSKSEPDPLLVSTTNTISQKFDWRAVESEDYRKYIANLRSIGCPEETIRDIIVADVNKLYESKRQQLAGAKKKFEFWKPGSIMSASLDPELVEKQQALQKEKRELLKELLGSAYEEKPELAAGFAHQIEQMFDFLPAEKRSKVFDVFQEMQAKMQKAMKNGTPDHEDIQKATKETEAAIAAILTPEEMLDYNLRMSTTANVMRMQSAGFEPTEQEFLDVFKLRKAYDDEYGGGFGIPSSDKEEKAKADAAKKELDDQIKKTLGDSRYAEYERAQDYSYQTLSRIGDKNGVSRDNINKVHDMRKVAEDQATRIRSDKSLNEDARNAALAGVRIETENAMRKLLGDKTYNSVQDQNGYYWLNNINPNPKSNSK